MAYPLNLPSNLSTIDVNWVDTSYSIIEFFKSLEPKESLLITTWNVGLQNDNFMSELKHELRQWKRVTIYVGLSYEHYMAVRQFFIGTRPVSVRFRRYSHTKLWAINKERLFVGSKNLAADGCDDLMVEVPYDLRQRLLAKTGAQVKIVSLNR